MRTVSLKENDTIDDNHCLSAPSSQRPPLRCNSTCAPSSTEKPLPQDKEPSKSVYTETLADEAPRKPKSFKELLENSSNSDLLIQKFTTQTKTLRLSDARSADFSFTNAQARMIQGYLITLFDYKSQTHLKVHLSADGHGIMIKAPFCPEKLTKYHQFVGVILGAMSSTFIQFNDRLSLNQLGLESTDCFSLVTHSRTFDFATHSDLAKYDIILVVNSYLGAVSQHLFSRLPIRKGLITIFKVKQKLAEMANERRLSVKELLLVSLTQLAIVTSLMEQHKDQKMIDKVKRLLDKSFKPSSKLFRMMINQKPSHVQSSNDDKMQQRKRLAILNRKMGYKLFNQDANYLQLMGNWSAIKNSKAVFAFKPLKSYLVIKTRELRDKQDRFVSLRQEFPD